MQSRWNTWPQFPNAIDKPLSLVADGFAWYSMEGSLSELRQMAHYKRGAQMGKTILSMELIGNAGSCCMDYRLRLFIYGLQLYGSLVIRTK